VGSERLREEEEALRNLWTRGNVWRGTYRELDLVASGAGSSDPPNADSRKSIRGVQGPREPSAPGGSGLDDLEESCLSFTPPYVEWDAATTEGGGREGEGERTLQSFVIEPIAGLQSPRPREPPIPPASHHVEATLVYLKGNKTAEEQMASLLHLALPRLSLGRVHDITGMLLRANLTVEVLRLAASAARSGGVEGHGGGAGERDGAGLGAAGAAMLVLMKALGEIRELKVGEGLAIAAAIVDPSALDRAGLCSSSAV
jgi:hypothetical protein